MPKDITQVEGIEVGNYTHREASTGCTVVLCREGAVAGVDVRGGGPGTRETSLLETSRLVERAHAVLLSGGSAYGLDAASGVMRYLEERGIGYKKGTIVVPIVPAAILFDLNLVTSQTRPGASEGYQACLACTNEPVEEGSVGAGTGATVGKVLGMERAIKGGLGSASLSLPEGLVVGALVAVNAYGSVIDPKTGETIAGPRKDGNCGFHDSVDTLMKGLEAPVDPATTTTIGVVATNASLTVEQANYLARVAHDGLALTIRPCHTIRDGDTLFAMATARASSPPNLVMLGVAAVEAVAQAVLRAVRMAEGLGGVPSIQELGNS